MESNIKMLFVKGVINIWHTHTAQTKYTINCLNKEFVEIKQSTLLCKFPINVTLLSSLLLSLYSD